MSNDLKYLIDIVTKASQMVTDDFMIKAKDENNDLITDFDIEIEKFVKDLLSKNIPVSAIGLQMHISVENPPVSRIEETIQMFAELGLKVLVTEMEVSVYESEKEERKEYTPELLEKQAQRYKELFECFKRCAKKRLAYRCCFMGHTRSPQLEKQLPCKRKNRHSSFI